ncbi:MAG: hypothetical protein AAF617_04405 [Bacteroidota bacterium]
MITKKGKTYLLLTIVLGIWGAIGYQIYSKFSPEETPVLAANSNVHFSPKQTIERDTFRINTQHRDPFLGTPYQPKQAHVKRTATPKKEPIVFPSIAYRGVISKQQSIQNIYIMDINGTQQLFKVGKEIQYVKLLKGNKKSVTIVYKGQRQTIAVSN